MWLNKGALHVCLSNKGHVSTMMDGALSRNACGCLCQLQVHKLLQCGGHVVCPKGLNGGLEPVLLSVLQPPVWDMNTLSRPVCKSLLLQVDLPWAMPSDKMPLVPGPHKASTPPSSPHSATECPSEMANCTSMATELQELLSQTVLDTSAPASWDSTLRRPTSVAQGAPSNIRAEDPLRLDRPVLAMLKLMATSQQVSPQAVMPNDAVPISLSPSPTLVSETPRQPLSLPPCNLRLILGQTGAPSPTKYSDCKGR